MSLSVIWLRLPQVKTQPQKRPRTCPNCNSYILQRWGRITKPVRDTHELEVEIHRYRCCDCGKTFRAYPEGVDRAERSTRMRQLAALGVLASRIQVSFSLIRQAVAVSSPCLISSANA